MSIKKDETFDRIIQRLEGEFNPVTPLYPPWLRALLLLPLWLVLLLVVLGLFGLRQDYSALGTVAAWGFTFAQAALSYALVVVGLRSIIPGQLSSWVVIVLSMLLALLAQVAFALISWDLSPSNSPPGQEIRLFLVCLGTTSVMGLLPFVTIALLAQRGLPLRPGPVGALLGLASGLSAEAAWRIHCSVTSLGHAAAAHFGAVVLLASLGTVAGLLWARRFKVG